MPEQAPNNYSYGRLGIGTPHYLENSRRLKSVGNSNFSSSALELPIEVVFTRSPLEMAGTAKKTPKERLMKLNKIRRTSPGIHLIEHSCSNYGCSDSMVSIELFGWELWWWNPRGDKSCKK